MRAVFACLILLFAAEAYAESVMPVRPIRAHSVVTFDDLAVVQSNFPGAIGRVEDVVGLETRKALYPGRPIFVGDVGPVALVERNDILTMRYKAGPLTITAEGRALDRASLGERVRVMNLDSRTIVVGVIRADKVVEVGQ